MSTRRRERGTGDLIAGYANGTEQIPSGRGMECLWLHFPAGDSLYQLVFMVEEYEEKGLGCTVDRGGRSWTN